MNAAAMVESCRDEAGAVAHPASLVAALTTKGQKERRETSEVSLIESSNAHGALRPRRRTPWTSRHRTQTTRAKAPGSRGNCLLGRFAYLHPAARSSISLRWRNQIAVELQYLAVLLGGRALAKLPPLQGVWGALSPREEWERLRGHCLAEWLLYEVRM